MNLRDEIKQVCEMWLKPAFGNGTKEESKWMVKDIMEIFEKRFEVKTNEILEKIGKIDKQFDIKVYREIGFSNKKFVSDVFDELKQEMLKK